MPLYLYIGTQHYMCSQILSSGREGIAALSISLWFRDSILANATYLMSGKSDFCLFRDDRLPPSDLKRNGNFNWSAEQLLGK